MTVVAIPVQYATNTVKSWDKYRYALENGTPSMQNVSRNVLMNYLNLCSVALGRPTTAPPYVDPPIAPAVETDDGEPFGDATGQLVYPD